MKTPVSTFRLSGSRLATAVRICALVCCLEQAASTLAQTNGTVRILYASVGREGEALRCRVEAAGLRALASIAVEVRGKTATDGLDFVSVVRRIELAPGVYPQEAEWHILEDDLAEGTETVELFLSDPTGGVVIGNPNRMTGEIEDNDTESFTFNYLDAMPTVLKSHEIAEIFVRRSTDLGASEVQYRTEGGTALPNVDYVPAAGTLSFPDGIAVIPVRILMLKPTNNPAERDKWFNVVLSDPGAGYIVSQPSQLKVTILNDGAGFALRPRFGTNDLYEISEIAGVAEVEVIIVGEARTNTVTVGCRTESQSATPGADFAPVSGTLTFLPGEKSKVLAIPIINDAEVQGSRSFKIVLHSPGAGFQLSHPREVEVFILENERGYFADLGSWRITTDLSLDYWGATEEGVLEKDATITVNVRREGDYVGPSSVRYQVTTESDERAPGSATAGADFIAAEGVLSFAPGETNQAFSFKTLADNLIEGTENFFVRLSDPTGDTPVERKELSVSILDGQPNQVRVDPDFKPQWPVSKTIWRGVNAAVQPRDGSIYLATPEALISGENGDRLLRLLPTGEDDESWDAPIFDGTIFSILPLINGDVVVAAGTMADSSSVFGPNFKVNGVPRNHLVRLKSDGSLDPSLSVALPTNQYVMALTIQSNLQILAVVGSFAAPYSDSALYRLTASGRMDFSFSPTQVDDSPLAVLQDGRIMAGSKRLFPNGSPDLSYKAAGEIKAVLPDGRAYSTVWTNGITWLNRLDLTGRVDPAFGPSAIGDGDILPTSDGKIWVAYQSRGSWGYTELCRLLSDGTSDPEFPPARMFGYHGVMTSPAKMHLLPSGDLLLSALPHTQINGQLRGGLTRVLTGTRLPRLEVYPASAMVSEAAGTATIKIVKCGVLSSESAAYDWRTDNDSARAGIDYVAASGQVLFPAGEAMASIELKLIDNSLVDESRRLMLRLRSNGANGQEQPPLEVWIANDDPGFVVNRTRAFQNGRFLVRAGGNITTIQSCYDRPYVTLEESSDLSTWAWKRWETVQRFRRENYDELLVEPNGIMKNRFYRWNR